MTVRARIMRLFALALLLASACSPAALQTQAAVASSVAVVANVLLVVLGKAYEADLLDSIRRAATAEDERARAAHRPAARAPAMDAAEAEVNARWTPIWGGAGGDLGAWETFRALHDAWATQLEAGQASAALGDRVNAAYCDLLALTPPRYRALITIPLIPCPPEASR